MAISSVTTGNYLDRDDSYIDPTSAFTIAMWFRQGTSTPTGGTFRTLYNYGDDLGVNPYLYIGSDTDTSNLVIGSWDGATYLESAAFTPVAGTWYYVAMVYDGANSLKLYVDGTLIDTITVTVSGFTFVEQDGVIGGSWMDFAWGYVGVWQAALNVTQLNTQRLAATPQTTALSFTPLIFTTDLSDSTGNGHGWTSHASLVQATTDPLNTRVSQIAVEALEQYDATVIEGKVYQVAVEALEQYAATQIKVRVYQVAVEVLYSFNGDCNAQPPIPPDESHGCPAGLGSGPATGGPGCAPSNL